MNDIFTASTFRDFDDIKFRGVVMRRNGSHAVETKPRRFRTHALKDALRECRRLTLAPLFATDPHGAQYVARHEVPDWQTPTSSHLFVIHSDGPGSPLVLTGEELDSLAAQWLKFRRKARK